MVKVKHSIIICLLLLWATNIFALAQKPATNTSATGKSTLKELINKIEKDTDYTFLFNSSIDLNQEVNATAGEKNVNATMTKALAGKNIFHEISGKQIVLKNKQGSTQQKATLKVEGRIVDAEGEPLIGASILVKGSTNGTVSNTDGYFVLDVPEKGSILVISLIGFASQEIKVDGQSQINITMLEDDQLLDEVVVIGYGTQRRSLVSSAISTFKPDMNVKKTLDPGDMLDGTIAGVTIAKTSGNLGAGLSFNIRGAGSISGGNEPLIVVDGMPLMKYDAQINDFGESMSSMVTISSHDIESIEVLKDAASAAIYGSRATNGVVLITTKSGKEGKAKFDLNLNMGFSQFPNRDGLKMTNSNQWVEIVNEGRLNFNNQNGYTPASSNYQHPIMNPYQGMPDYDWLGGVLQTAKAYNVDASFSGGDKKTTFFIGGSYTSEDGLIQTNHMDKISLKANIKHKMSNWLEIGANNSAVYTQNNRIPGSGLGTNTIGRTITQRPFDRPYKPNGDYYVGGTSDLTYHNMVQILNEEKTHLDNLRYLGSFFGTIEILKGLKWKSSISIDVAHTDDYIYYNENHPYGSSIGVMYEDVRLQKNYQVDNYLTYANSWNDIGWTAMAGHSFQNQETKNTGITGQGFASPSLDVTNAAGEIVSAGSNITGYAMESYFGRLSMDYEEKYIMTATLRADGSSKFAPKHRWGYFPSLSVGWNASKESFWNASQTDLKVRASYGKTGNQENISKYNWRYMMTGGASYNNKPGIAISQSTSVDLEWEKADQYDLGFDLSFLKGRINIMTDFYLKNTFELIWNRKVASTTGFNNRYDNIGKARNKGIEFTINTDFNLGKVKWNSSFNITHNKNKLLSIDGGETDTYLYSIRAYKVGEEIGIWYLPKAIGIYQTNDEVPEKLYNSGVRAGDVKYLDKDDNGIINSDDYEICGSSNPKISGGWTNTFAYKDFNLSFLFTYKYGHKVYSSAMYQSTRIGATANVLEVAALNRWTGEGTSNVWPRSYPSSDNNYKHSSRFLQDGSHLRLRTLTFSYNVPAKILSQWGIKGIRAYVQGDNLFLVSAKGYIGYDPDSNNNTSGAGYQGYDNYIVPQPRTVTFGLNLSF